MARVRIRVMRSETTDTSRIFHATVGTTTRDPTTPHAIAANGKLLFPKVANVPYTTVRGEAIGLPSILSFPFVFDIAGFFQVVTGVLGYEMIYTDTALFSSNPNIQ